MQKHLILLAFLATINVQAEIIDVSATKDNTLFETNSQPLSNGAGIYFFIGRTNQGINTLRRGLLQFDLTDLPPGSIINDATLEITSSRTIAGPRTAAIHSALIDWGESTSDAGGEEGAGTNAEVGDATWTNAFHEGTAWSTAGGDFDPVALASTVVDGDETIGFNSSNFTTKVQDWLDNPGSNFGLFVIGDESVPVTAYRFNTSENPVNPPKLIIDFTAPPVVAQLPPSKDNTLYETVDGSTSNGAGDRVFIGQIQSGLTRRAVMEFDVSGIPAAATIDSVTLDLSVTNIPGSAVGATAALHFATREWGAAGSNGSGNGAPSQTNDATWIHTFFDTDTWTNAGGDFIGTASATTSFASADTTINFGSSSGLIADVTTWIQNVDENHGWVMLGDEVNAGNARGLGSADNSNAALQPVLTVNYSLSDVIFADDFE